MKINSIYYKSVYDVDVAGRVLRRHDGWCAVNVDRLANDRRTAAVHGMQISPHVPIDAAIVRASLQSSTWLCAGVILEEDTIGDGAGRVVGGS